MQPTTAEEILQPGETVLTEENNQHQQPAVIRSVFYAIFVQTAKDFFGGIKNFLLRYIRHFAYCFKYLWHPTLQHHKLSKLDWKENCQQSFELSLLVVVSLLFMIKMDWIPATSGQLLEVYNNDLSQMTVEFMMFILFAVGYIAMILFSVLSGRIIRKLFSLKMDRHAADIVFTYLNNVMFSLSAIIAFFARSSLSAQKINDTDQFGGSLLTLVIVLFYPLLLMWGTRFCRLNRLSFLKSCVFVISVPLLFALILGFCGAMMTSVLIGL